MLGRQEVSYWGTENSACGAIRKLLEPYHLKPKWPKWLQLKLLRPDVAGSLTKTLPSYTRKQLLFASGTWNQATKATASERHNRHYPSFPTTQETIKNRRLPRPSFSMQCREAYVKLNRWDVSHHGLKATAKYSPKIHRAQRL